MACGDFSLALTPEPRLLWEGDSPSRRLGRKRAFRGCCKGCLARETRGACEQKGCLQKPQEEIPGHLAAKTNDEPPALASCGMLDARKKRLVFAERSPPFDARLFSARRSPPKARPSQDLRSDASRRSPLLRRSKFMRRCALSPGRAPPLTESSRGWASEICDTSAARLSAAGSSMRDRRLVRVSVAAEREDLLARMGLLATGESSRSAGSLDLRDPPGGFQLAGRHQTQLHQRRNSGFGTWEKPCVRSFFYAGFCQPSDRC